MNSNTKFIKEMWNDASNNYYKKNVPGEKIKDLIDNYDTAFHSTVLNMLNSKVGDLKGKKVLIPSSGDNKAAFAYSMMGADVVSADISENQISNAKKIAQQNNLDITFLVENTMTLDGLNDNEFDLVYTSNGVHVWIDDLSLMYKNINRVLKPNGKYILFEIHPFTRPFDFSLDNDLSKDVVIRKPYTSINYMYDEKIKTYHWRLQDYINAFVSAELNIIGFEEMLLEEGLFWVTEEEREKISPELYNNLNNWEYNKLAAIPQWMCICVQKQ